MIPRIFRFTAILSLLASTNVSLAAGMTSHAMMGDIARSHLPVGHVLIDLLAAHRPALIGGAMFPDGGYFTGEGFPEDRDLAETAHWDGFINALASVAHDNGCGELQADEWDGLPVLGGTVDWLSDELGRELSVLDVRIGESCGYLVAFLMGVAAHGMSDETWDALFEPQVYQRNEQQNSSAGYTLDSVPPGADPTVGQAWRDAFGDDLFDALAGGFSITNGVEYSMDVIAIRDHFVWDEVPVVVFPPPGDIVEAFSRQGKNIDEFAVQRAATGSRLLVAAERIAAALDYTRVRDQMPYASSQYLTGSGGIHDSARFLAGYYEHIWQRVVHGPDAAGKPFVVGVHPRPGDRNLPTHVCRIDSAPPTAPCSDDTQALQPIADRFIYVAMSGSMGSDFSDLDEPFAVFDEDGNKLDVKFTQNPPWATPGDAHGFRIELLGEHKVLKPDHRYTVVVTTQLYDSRGVNVEQARLQAPMVWHFRTASQ